MASDVPFRMVLQKPTSVRAQVYEQLRAGILEGRFSPSERLVEARIASELGVSRTPVREALHALEREGLLEAIPRVGYEVHGVRREELQEICAIRSVNERLAAEWALERITPAEVRALEENLATAEAEVRAGRPEAFVERDGEFHEILVGASRSARLVELCQNLRRHMLVYRLQSLYTAENALRAIDGHRQILTGLKAKDPEALDSAVSGHLDQVKRDVLHYAFDEARPPKAALETKDA